MSRPFEYLGKTGLSLSQKTGKLRNQFSDRNVSISVYGTTVDVTARQRKMCRCGEARCGTAVAAQHNIRRQRIVSKNG